MNLAKLGLMSSGGATQLYVDDVFSTYTYTGNGSTQTITNGIDLSTKDGMVWTKVRSTANSHCIVDTLRGAGKYLASNSVNAAGNDTGQVSAFTTTGYSIGSGSLTNDNLATYVSWTFRKAAKFFDVQTVTLGTGNATVTFSDLSTLGMVMVKRTDSTGSWYVWHRSLTAGKLLYLEQTAAEATLGHITVSGTTVTLVDGTLADGTYVVYGFAHDTATDGIIQCGSFTTDGSGVGQVVNLGWEPQLIIGKTATPGTGAWYISDTMRDMSKSGTKFLSANTSAAEDVSTTERTVISATGFQHTGGYFGTNQTVIYLAIRRPNKPPTTGTQVYNAIDRAGTGASATVTGVGFPLDLVITQSKSSGYSKSWQDRLRGAGNRLVSSSTAAELADTASITSFANNDGLVFGVDGSYGSVNTNVPTYINHFFRRAPGVFDVVCYTGTGVARTVNHNLGAVPELMIVKVRGTVAANTGLWAVYHTALGNTDYLRLNNTTATTAASGMWNNTTPTASVFTVGTNNEVNISTETYVAYLFATLAGISKVGSYTGTATTLQVDCGFTTGARFVLIKRSDAIADWYVWDTTRGIIAGNDPYLLLNSTAAEVTTTDYIDTYSSGFEISSTAPAAINASGGTFIYLAFA